MPARLRHWEWGAPPRFRASVARKPLSGSQGTGRCGRMSDDPRVRRRIRGRGIRPFAREGAEAMARVVTAVLLLLILPVALPARAQEPKKLDPVIVTGTKIETPAEQVGATVTVIDGE